MANQIKYDDWRDNVNPDLLSRYWESIGRPGSLLIKTKYGVDILRTEVSADLVVDVLLTWIDNETLKESIEWKDWKSKEKGQKPRD